MLGNGRFGIHRHVRLTATDPLWRARPLGRASGNLVAAAAFGFVQGLVGLVDPLPDRIILSGLDVREFHADRNNPGVIAAVRNSHGLDHGPEALSRLNEDG